LGKLVKIAPGSNKAEPFGEVSGLMEGDFGLIGLAVDASGNVYGGVFSANPEAHGVWKFDGTTGAETRVDGSQSITLPNAVDFSGDGTMYVTDTIAGAIWRVPVGGAAEEWITDPLLAGNESFGFPFPVGANGIVVRDRTVYVGVSETGLVVTVPINSDGSAGQALVFAEVADVFIDGIALDEQGNVYIANPMADAIVKVSANGTVETIAGAGDGLDTPTSLVIGTGAGNENTLYVSNFSVGLGRPLGAGPSIVAIELAE
jgi:sugar lactone lactonase YvrE